MSVKLEAAERLAAELTKERDEARDRGVGVGMVIAAAIIVRVWGDEVQATEILGAAGITTTADMRRFGVDAYDVSALRNVLRQMKRSAPSTLQQSEAAPICRRCGRDPRSVTCVDC